MTSTSTSCCAGGPRLLRHEPHAGGLQPVRDQGKQGGRTRDDHDCDNDGQDGQGGCVVDDHDNDQGGRGGDDDDHDSDNDDQGGRGGRQAGAGFPRGRQ